jgi:MFS transporter, putative metabolite:H+ symporter
MNVIQQPYIDLTTKCLPRPSAAERLDALPVSRYHYQLIGIIGLGLFLDAFEIGMASSVLGALLKQGWSTLRENGYLVTATFLGLTLGCWFSGVLGDKFGRKFSYQANLAIFGGSSLLAVFAPNMQVLIALRFVMGIGLGAELVLGYATLAEFAPPRERGRLVASLSFLAQCGIFVSSLVALWVIPHLGWRAMFAIAGIAAVGVWLLRKLMPESPRWLEEQGRFAEAHEIILMMERKAGVQSPPEREWADEAGLPITPIKHDTGFATLFSADLRTRTAVGLATLCVVQICLYGMVTWLPTFFVQQGFSIVKSLQWNTIMNLGGPAGGIIGLLLADRMGRRPILITAALVSVVISAFYVTLRSETLLIGMGFLLVTSFEVIVVVGQAVYVSELFPTSVRMRGTGLCSTIARLLAASIQFVIPPLFAAGGVQAIVGSVAASLVLFAICIAYWGIETKERALEEISAMR